MEKTKWHILCEKDVGLFSLIQQVVAHIPLAISEDRIPLALYGNSCCYWTPEGHRGKDNVWEYYFEPINPDYPASSIDESIRIHIRNKPPHFQYPGYSINESVFVSNNFGDHPSFKGKTLKIPYKWADPDEALRRRASQIIETYVRPRAYILEKVTQFYQEHLAGQYVIGVHMRATDVTDSQEHNIHRRGSYKLERYLRQIDELLQNHPDAKIFAATDSLKALEGLKEAFNEKVLHASTIYHASEKVSGTGPLGGVIPGYLSGDSQKAAQNGEEAVIDYLLLSKCQYLVHNGSGLARTALLKNADLAHHNIHSKTEYVKTLWRLDSQELRPFLKFSYRHLLQNMKKPIKRLINWDK